MILKILWPVVDGRAELVEETYAGAADVRAYIAAETRKLLAIREFLDAHPGGQHTKAIFHIDFQGLELHAFWWIADTFVIQGIRRGSAWRSGWGPERRTYPPYKIQSIKNYSPPAHLSPSAAGPRSIKHWLDLGWLMNEG